MALSIRDTTSMVKQGNQLYVIMTTARQRYQIKRLNIIVFYISTQLGLRLRSRDQKFQGYSPLVMAVSVQLKKLNDTDLKKRIQKLKI